MPVDPAALIVWHEPQPALAHTAAPSTGSPGDVGLVVVVLVGDVGVGDVDVRVGVVVVAVVVVAVVGVGVVGAGLPESDTPMPRVPFMPAAAWPGTVHRYSYVPFLRPTIMRPDFPGARSGVTVPTHEFDVPPVGLAQILNECEICPSFLTSNTTVPAGTIFSESSNSNSEGFPAVTVITVLFGAKELFDPLAAELV